MRQLLAALGLLLPVSACNSSNGSETTGHGWNVGGQGGNGAAASGGTVTSGGAPGDGGTPSAAGALGTGGTAPTPSLLDAEASHFLDYGTLRIAFTEAVDASSLKLKFIPAQPSQLKATGFTEVDATTVDVTLAYNHLPLDYEVTLTGARQDGSAFTTSATIAGLHNGARLAFITKQFGSGDVRTWPGAPSDASSGLEAADAVCQSEADAAGFKGTFVAYLSVSGSDDAGCRAFGLSGTLADKCGQASMPSDHTPWLSTTGLPIVNGASDIVADRWQTPVPFHADGTRSNSTADYGSTVRHGTSSGGVASGRDCGGWTVSTVDEASDATTFAGEYLLEPSSVPSCDEELKLLCLQVGDTFFGSNTLHQVGGKRVFVSKGKLSGAMSFGGLTAVGAADALCQSEADAALYENAANFRAFLKTTSDDALCHVLGGSGKVTDSCGLGALPADDLWRRPDDYPVGTAQEFSGLDDLIAPILYDSEENRLSSSVEIWSGALDGSKVDHTCEDWTSTSGTANVAVATSTAAWDLWSSSDCNLQHPVLCFEQ